LVFKRALALTGGPEAQVAGGIRSTPYQTALAEWTLSGRTEDAARYFNPFESVRVTTGGYRGKKYASNGPDNTWSGWGSALDPTPVVHVRGTSNPKSFAYVEIPAADLQRHFLSAAADESDVLPRLIDLAVWWLRARDVEALGIDDASGPQDLIDLLVAEAGLSRDEIAAMFDADDDAIDAS
jgi:hypothetical protein